MGRGLAPAAAISMSDRQYSLLLSESTKRSLANGIKVRIRILLEASQGKAIGHAAKELGIGKNMVKRWRKRWESHYKEISAFEQGSSQEGVSDKALLEKMFQYIKDAPRKGIPKKFSPEQEKNITALACQKPEEYGIEVSKWTHKLLAETVVSKGIVKEISASTVGLILKKTN